MQWRALGTRLGHANQPPSKTVPYNARVVHQRGRQWLRSIQLVSSKQVHMLAPHTAPEILRDVKRLLLSFESELYRKRYRLLTSRLPSVVFGKVGNVRFLHLAG